MKRIYIIVSGAALVASACLWTGCSDDFLKEKTDYSRLSPDIYNNYTGAQMRVNDIYLRLLPNANSGVTYRWPSAGRSDVQTQATEEYTGVGYYTDPKSANNLPYTTGAPALFNESYKTSESPYGEIRNCNDIIEGISNGTLTDDQKKELLGQIYFFRAWQYYLLVKSYGGVPIVDKVQAADVSMLGDAKVPRSTTKECIEFICTDLEKAFEMLPDAWGSNDVGRVNKGTALAVMGRVRLLYASPLFNRADDIARWQAAYDANKRAKDWLDAHGYGLAYLNTPGVNAAGWAKMFSGIADAEVRKEAVFVTLYNMLNDNNAANEIWRNNSREQGLRPANASGAGTGTTATARMVDMFPMADGKRPGSSSILYDQLVFFKDRDPRFYRTFAFPGVYWRFDGNGLGLDGMPELGKVYDGKDYVLWNYAWYADAATRTSDTEKGYGADKLGENNHGVYVRKRCNDFDLDASITAPTRMYRWPAKFTDNSSAGLFGEGAMPHMEIRYAEVLLNLAEAACGVDRLSETFDMLKLIRQRAGYDPAGPAGANYGLELGDRGAMFGAVLYERQIEFAYEGKRFDDMRRWLLWDGGENFSQVTGAPSTWTLSGYGGSTINYLGYWMYTDSYPFNGKLRDNLELCVTVDAPRNDASDPVKAFRPANTDALDLKKTMVEQATQIGALATFYTNRLERKKRRGDSENRVVSFLPQFYFLGLSSGAQSRNPDLRQTIGWADTKNGDANGTFDPLAE